MTHKRFVLTFPPELTSEPITYRLIKDFDIMVNILNADISPGKIGHLVLEMSAPTKVLRNGIEYIRVWQAMPFRYVRKKLTIAAPHLLRQIIIDLVLLAQGDEVAGLRFAFFFC